MVSICEEHDDHITCLQTFIIEKSAFIATEETADKATWKAKRDMNADFFLSFIFEYGKRMHTVKKKILNAKNAFCLRHSFAFELKETKLISSK